MPDAIGTGGVQVLLIVDDGLIEPNLPDPLDAVESW